MYPDPACAAERFRAITSPGQCPSRGNPYPMPQLGPDQRQRNRRPRRRSQMTSRAPVTEFDEMQELEAARERNDLDVTDLRDMSVTELRAVGKDLELETGTQERKDDLVERILERQTERAGHAYATGILDIVDEGFGFMRRHGLLPSPDDVYVSSSQVRRFGLRIGDRVSGAVRAPRDAEKYWGMLRVDAVNGVDIETARNRPVFGDLTPVHPDELINIETDPEEPQPAADQPRQPARQGPACPHRQPAEGRQDDAPQAHRQRDQHELPGRSSSWSRSSASARRKSRTCVARSRAKSSARPSTSRRRTTPTSPRWRSRSPSARSRPAVTS